MLEQPWPICFFKFSHVNIINYADSFLTSAKESVKILLSIDMYSFN